MTRSLYALIALAVLLSLGHHVDHILRGATGWPVTGEVSPFTYSLAVYPLIATGLLMSWRRRVGPRFWFALTSCGALFVLAVHVGPAADDTLARIDAAYSSPVAAAAALGGLGLFVATLVGLSLYEVRLWRGRGRRPTAEQAGQGN